MKETKKNFEEPKSCVIRFISQDVIATSWHPTEDNKNKKTDDMKE